MEYSDLNPDSVAEAVRDELQREVDYLDVEVDGARRAASMISALI